MKNKRKTTTIDVKRWIERSISLDNVDIEQVENALIKHIEDQGFMIKENSHTDDSSSIVAIYGTKKRAFTVSLIPIIGQHLTAGKRLLLKAHLKKKESVELDISITPYMELINSEEYGNPITQSIPEKASDDFVSARKLIIILRSLYTSLGLAIPRELSELDTKAFAHDTFWGILAFYLEDYSSSKFIHKTSHHTPWSWGAFVIPEFWFMWHELWGAHFLFILPSGIWGYFDRMGGPPWPNDYVKLSVIGLIILFRIIAGFTGNKIFFARYGYYPNEATGSDDGKKYIVPDNGPKWNWRAFIIPELWFMWNEIVGISLFAIVLNFLVSYYFLIYVESFKLTLTLLLFIRILFGLVGNRVYYSKYGYWPGQ
jgi:hypothetical protein